ncbi:MAG: ExbD/TolR family protein [Fibrobacterota bacterium]
MKLTLSNRQDTPTEAAGEGLNVDVTPIMNLMIVLIPILISMTVFTHYSIHSFYLPSNAADATEDESRVQLKTTVVVRDTALLVTLGDRVIDSLAVQNGVYETARLRSAVEKARAMSDDSLKAVVSVGDAVVLDRFVTIMDLCRDAGFEDLGLSAAEGG